MRGEHAAVDQGTARTAACCPAVLGDTDGETWRRGIVVLFLM